jgi:hypothetical protein
MPQVNHGRQELVQDFELDAKRERQRVEDPAAAALNPH